MFAPFIDVGCAKVPVPDGNEVAGTGQVKVCGFAPSVVAVSVEAK